jgi:hypothetical protein
MKRPWYIAVAAALAGLLLPGAVEKSAAAEELASKDELYTGQEYSSAFANPEDDPKVIFRT